MMRKGLAVVVGLVLGMLWRCGRRVRQRPCLWYRRTPESFRRATETWAALKAETDRCIGAGLDRQEREERITRAAWRAARARPLATSWPFSVSKVLVGSQYGAVVDARDLPGGRGVVAFTIECNRQWHGPTFNTFFWPPGCRHYHVGLIGEGQFALPTDAFRDLGASQVYLGLLAERVKVQAVPLSAAVCDAMRRWEHRS